MSNYYYCSVSACQCMRRSAVADIQCRTTIASCWRSSRTERRKRRRWPARRKISTLVAVQTKCPPVRATFDEPSTNPAENWSVYLRRFLPHKCCILKFLACDAAKCCLQNEIQYMLRPLNSRLAVINAVIIIIIIIIFVCLRKRSFSLIVVWHNRALYQKVT